MNVAAPARLLFILALLHISSHSLPAQPHELRAGPLTFFFWPGYERAASTLAQGALQSPPMPGLPTDVLAEPVVEVYLAPDRARFDSLAPGAPDWSSGVAFPEGDRIVLPTFAPRTGTAPLATVLRHELAHIAIRRYLGARVPRWFHEGYAQVAAGSWHSGDAWALRFAIVMGQVPSLSSLNLSFERERLGAEHAYLLAYTAVEYLYRLGGPQGFARLLERWREVGSLDSAMRRTYGITFWQFERLWRRQVRDRYGWLLVASQTAVYWAVLTILLLALGYIKKKRTRQKLEALDAATRDLPDLDFGGDGPESEPPGG